MQHSKMSYQIISLTLTGVIFFSSLVQIAVCQGKYKADTETILLDTLFANYTRYRKPVELYSKTIPVGINLYILSLNEVDVKSQTLHLASWLEVTWTDEYLTWNTSEFSNIQYLRLPAVKVWVPVVCNLQEISGKKCVTYVSVKNSGSEVGVENTGRVFLSETIESIIICSFNVQKFPFDTQTCSFEFFSPNYFLQNIHLVQNQSSFQSGYYIPNEEWDLVSTTVKEVGYYTLEMTITLRRIPLFPTLSLIFPIIALSIMNTFCSLLPIESGEKMGMSMAIFLTFAVFGSMISDSMPKNSVHISWFSVYVTTQIILNGFSVIMVTVVLHIYYKDVVSSRTLDLVEDNSGQSGTLHEMFAKRSSVQSDIQNKKQEKKMCQAKRLDRCMMIFTFCTNVVSFCVYASLILS